MSGIDFNSEAAYYHVKPLREWFKREGTIDRYPWRRPPINQQEREIGAHVRSVIERVQVGYATDYDTALHTAASSCQRCGGPIDVAADRVVRQIWRNGQPENFYICHRCR